MRLQILFARVRAQSSLFCDDANVSKLVHARADSYDGHVTSTRAFAMREEAAKRA